MERSTRFANLFVGEHLEEVMRKLVAFLVAGTAIAVATPVLAQSVVVHTDGYHRHHRAAVIVHHPRRDVVVVHRHGWREGWHDHWHHARRGGAVVIDR
jgi:hypothetical protein